MENKKDCLLCGQEIVYSKQAINHKCIYCHKEYPANTSCKSGHFVCDTCHGAKAGEVISAFCLNTKDTDPLAMALRLMRHPAVKMHGPEHHYLIAAVLISAYCNVASDRESLPAKLMEAQKRAANVLGGFCGFYGSCGAAVGCGIFMSIITGATPLSGKEWQLTNLITASALNKIALNGGPRCCKRNVFLAIEAAEFFLKDHFKVHFDSQEDKAVCSFFSLNKDCRAKECLFYPVNKGMPMSAG